MVPTAGRSTPTATATKYQLVTFATGAVGNGIGKFQEALQGDFDGMDDDGTIAQYIVADDKGSPMKDKDGNFVFAKYKVEVDKDGQTGPGRQRRIQIRQGRKEAPMSPMTRTASP